MESPKIYYPEMTEVSQAAVSSANWQLINLLQLLIGHDTKVEVKVQEVGKNRTVLLRVDPRIAVKGCA